MISDVLKGLPIDNKSKNALMTLRMGMFWDASDALSAQLYNGDLTIGAWQEAFKAEIRQLHTSMAAIVKGGWDEMKPQDWGRLGTPLRNEYRFLQGFAEHISNNRDTISLEYLKNRARLYGHGAKYSAVLEETPLYIQDLLPWLPKDSSTECYHRCRCYWRLEVVDTSGGWNVVTAHWITQDDLESCPTCMSRKGHVESMRIPEDVKIPQTIGGY